MPLIRFLSIFNGNDHHHEIEDEEIFEYDLIEQQQQQPQPPPPLLDSVFLDHTDPMNNNNSKQLPPFYKYTVELGRRNSFLIPEIGSDSTISLETCKRLSDAGFFLVNCSNYEKRVCCCMCFSSFPLYDNQELTSDPLIFHREKNPNCKFVQNYIEHRSKKIYNHEESMYYERERLDSFIDWPVPWLDPKELAFNGFYYLRNKDQTRCAFCKIIISGWVPDLDIKTTHCLINPNCPLLNNNVFFNIPIVASDILKRISPPDENCYPIPNIYKRLDHQRKISYDSSILAGVYPTKPLKKYSTIGQRKASFNNENWPRNSIKQTPDELANAGFYYSGIGDVVYCHHCNCGLKNWKFDDDPINEHLKWFPNCSFIKMIDQKPRVDGKEEEEEMYKYEREYNVSVLTDEDFEILITSCLNTSRWLQMYPYDVVKESIKLKLRKTGSPIISKENLAVSGSGGEEGKLIFTKQYNNRRENISGGEDVSSSSLTFLPSQFNNHHHPRDENNNDDDADNNYSDEMESEMDTDSNCEACRQNEVKYKCNICFKRDKNVIFYPCNHLFSCKSCFETLYLLNQPSFSCPICRRVIEYHAIFKY